MPHSPMLAGTQEVTGPRGHRSSKSPPAGSQWGLLVQPPPRAACGPCPPTLTCIYLSHGLCRHRLAQTCGVEGESSMGQPWGLRASGKGRGRAPGQEGETLCRSPSVTQGPFLAGHMQGKGPSAPPDISAGGKELACPLGQLRHIVLDPGAPTWILQHQPFPLPFAGWQR